MTKRLLLVSSLVGVFTTNLYAQELNKLPPIYVGLATGWSATHFAGFNNNGLYAVRAFGGYNFMPNIGAELAYTSYRSATANSSYIKQASYDVLGVFNFPLIDHFSIYTKLGTALMKAKVKPADGGADMKVSSWRFAYGVGFNYDFSAHLLGTVGWYHVNSKKAAFTDNMDLPGADFYSLGLSYRF